MDVLIADEPDKLPPHIRDLEDPTRPLPAGAQFFEEKFTSGRLAKQFIAGLVLTIVGTPILLLFL